MRLPPLLRQGRRLSLRGGYALGSFRIEEPPLLGGFFLCGGFTSRSLTQGTQSFTGKPRVFPGAPTASFGLRMHLLPHGISTVRTLRIEDTRFEFWYGNVWRVDRILSRLGR